MMAAPLIKFSGIIKAIKIIKKVKMYAFFSKELKKPMYFINLLIAKKVYPNLLTYF